jgi:hypothetical protein
MGFRSANRGADKGASHLPLQSPAQRQRHYAPADYHNDGIAALERWSERLLNIARNIDRSSRHQARKALVISPWRRAAANVMFRRSCGTRPMRCSPRRLRPRSRTSGLPVQVSSINTSRAWVKHAFPSRPASVRFFQWGHRLHRLVSPQYFLSRSNAAPKTLQHWGRYHRVLRPRAEMLRLRSSQSPLTQVANMASASFQNELVPSDSASYGLNFQLTPAFTTLSRSRMSERRDEPATEAKLIVWVPKS